MDDEARALRAQIEALTAAVQALAGTKAPAGSSITVAELAARYRSRTSKAAMHTLDAFLVDFAARDVGSLRKVDYVMWRDARAARTTVRRRAPAVGTLNQELIQVLAMFRWGVAHEIIDVSPFEGVQKLKGQRARETEIDPHEHAAVFADAPLLVRAFQATCIETGMRNGCEVLRMERSHIDRARAVIHVPRANTKGKLAARDVPMSDYLRDMLDEVPVVVGCPFVFGNPETRRPYTARYMAALSRPYLDRLTPAAGDGKVVTHDGRHSMISRLVRGGIHPFASMKIVGHKTAGQHWRYMHVSEADRTRVKHLLDAQRAAPHRSPEGNERNYIVTQTPQKGGGGHSK